MTGNPSVQAQAKTVSFITRHGWLVPVLLLGILVLAMFFSMCVGRYPISFWHSAGLLLRLISPFHPSQAWDLKEYAVVRYIRPPRVLVAAFAGLGLGMAGTALQGMLRNPLVGPDILGVSSGAAFGAIVAASFNLPLIGTVPCAFIGGLLALSAVFGLAKLAHESTASVMLILSGVFIGGFFLALIGLIEAYGNVYRAAHWLVGSFGGANWAQVFAIGIPAVTGATLLMIFRWRLNLLSLGDLDAKTLGINVGLLRWILLATVSLMIAGQVAVSGIIAWVGLVLPHCARLLVGPDHRRLLPAAGLLGALMLVGLDDLTRSGWRIGLPINLLSAIVGTPLICFLFWKSQGKGWS